MLESVHFCDRFKDRDKKPERIEFRPMQRQLIQRESNGRVAQAYVTVPEVSKVNLVGDASLYQLDQILESNNLQLLEECPPMFVADPSSIYAQMSSIETKFNSPVNMDQVVQEPPVVESSQEPV